MMGSIPVLGPNCLSRTTFLRTLESRFTAPTMDTLMPAETILAERPMLLFLRPGAMLDILIA
ncbi:hypothetical protein RSOL_471010 [Rhizoctonia solani AG-3 Rhs1AP]|uniref:Uncharacterized protein n=1 Tax=Rhizoctonia solani AG-3 Rhs1AP TaxID=1086054 RepID=X8JR43_9AGAM|nr:hypothetical protein RSOL_471010 [Rhizoctonia solani AG-3 Rhs1AP]